MAEPWTPEKRSRVKRKIDKEAERAAARLGAASVTIIAFFRDGEYLHMQDGGAAPMPSNELYTKLATATAIIESGDGSDVSIS